MTALRNDDMKNLRLAVRMLVRTPTLSAIAILSLAVGIGANAAIFSLYNQLLLRPLPVADRRAAGEPARAGAQARVAVVQQRGRCEKCSAIRCSATWSGPGAVQRRRRRIAWSRTNLGFQNQTIAGQGMLVSGSYFGVLGLTPAAGRLMA